METTIEYNKLIDIEKARKNFSKEHEILLSDISILENRQLNDLKNEKLDDIKKIFSKYDSFYKKLNNTKLRNEIVLENKKYVLKNCEDLSFGQFMDLQEILKSEQIGHYEKIPNVLAILLNEEKDYVKYKNNFQHLNQLIKKANFDDVLGCVSFFLLKEKNKLINSPSYLKEKELTMKMMILTNINLLLIQIQSTNKSSTSIMGGIKRLWTWPITILLKYIKSKI